MTWCELNCAFNMDAEVWVDDDDPRRVWVYDPIFDPDPRGDEAPGARYRT